MANLKKTYFLVPSFDYPPPPTGPIELGAILTSPDSPDRVLNSGSSFVAPPPTKVITTIKKDWKSLLRGKTESSVGLYTKFLDVVLGAGVDVGTNWEREDEQRFAFDRMETVRVFYTVQPFGDEMTQVFFNPTDEEMRSWLDDAITATAVKNYLGKRSGFTKPPLYVVTGLKIVRGGKVNSAKLRGHGAVVSAGLDGTGIAVPVEAGPEVAVRQQKQEDVEWSGDDFVFAYRVSRLKVSSRTRQVREEEYTRGALFGLERNDAGNAQDKTYRIVEVEGDEAMAEEFESDELLSVKDDDDEDCICVLT